MSSLASIATVLTLASSAFAQTALVDRRFQYPNIPYKVDPDNGPRGTQQGYNLCNSTTQGQNSLCQTSFVNDFDDFCLWAPPAPGETVGDVEGEMVAWCTKEGHGTRIIPPGALQGVQFTRTPNYRQVVGFIDQSLINLKSDDTGGEMDSAGADRRGNPLGGIIFSNQFGRGNQSEYRQIIFWSNFMGSNRFCIKVCSPDDPNASRYCEHIYDRIGCAYNMPADYAKINGTFESCQGDSQLFPGVYVQNGATMTYQQPPESLGPITSIPYTAAIPPSSSCTPFTSASAYTATSGFTSSVPPTSSAPSSSGNSASSPTGSPAATGNGSGGSSNNNSGSGGNSGSSSLIGRTEGAIVLAIATAFFASLAGSFAVFGM